MTLFEIIEAVKSGNGAAVDRRELEHALVAMEALCTFSGRALMQLHKDATENGPALKMRAEREYLEDFRRVKTALGRCPTEWLGPDNVPESPEYQRRRAAALRLFDRLIAQDGGGR